MWLLVVTDSLCHSCTCCAHALTTSTVLQGYVY